MAHQPDVNEKIALACTLTGPDQVARMNELHQTLFKQIDRIVERKNSVELVFLHPDDTLCAQLLEFVKFERMCCPWLSFQLVFQPGSGPVSLRMGNSAETKAIAMLVMKLDR